MSVQEVVLLLGSNLGNKRENIEKALQLLEEQAGTVILKSSIRESVPAEYESTNNFCNIAVKMLTPHSPAHLLNTAKDIERKIGRMADSSVTGTYTDRIIDIDIVTYGHVKFWSARLQLPHEKHLYSRDFSRPLLRELEEAEAAREKGARLQDSCK